MLTRIEQIKGLGLLHDVAAAKYPCERATLIYAENARGKSTFTSLMRSLATNNTAELVERTTIGGKEDLGAKIQFDGGKTIHTLTKGAWNSHNPDIIVFDGHFVETNVYSGATVNTTQRQQLLDFALGDKAVVAQKDENDAVEALKKVDEFVQRTTARVAMLHPGLTLQEFRSLPDSTDFTSDLAALQSRLHSARNAATIQKTPALNLLEPPDIDIEAMLELLDKTLTDVQGAAETLLNAHLEILGTGGADWLAAGQHFDDHETCPYCGQSTAGIDLVSAYQAHFNEAYQSLKQSVIDTRQAIQNAVGDATLGALNTEIHTVNGACVGWQEHCTLELLPSDTTSVWAKTVAARVLIEALFEAKADRLAEFQPTKDNIDKARAAWTEVLGWYKAINATLTANNITIGTFKNGLATEQPTELDVLLKATEMAKLRHDATTVALLDDLDGLIKASKDANKVKKDARDQLTAVMTKTLATYRTDTNKYLKELGARFEIKMLDKSYKGGARAIYSIDLFGEEVS